MSPGSLCPQTYADTALKLNYFSNFLCNLQENASFGLCGWLPAAGEKAMSSSIPCPVLPLPSTYCGGSALPHGHQLSCLVLLQKDQVNKKCAHGRVNCILFID